MAEYVKVEEENQWKTFLKWYDYNVSNYEWHPITPADRVNIYNEESELVAYKYMGGEPHNFLIRRSEYNFWKASKIIDERLEMRMREELIDET